jgi:hypothetical protein
MKILMFKTKNKVKLNTERSLNLATSKLMTV